MEHVVLTGRNTFARGAFDHYGSGTEGNLNVSGNGLQKTAFFMLVALILYVSIMGGA